MMDKDSPEKKNRKTAREAAYSYLASRMRTAAEVRRHLSGKGYDGDEINDAVNELIGMRYLDDYVYAMRYYEYNREKRRGVLRAERELIERGVDRETASNAKEDFLYENSVDEFRDALEIARRELSGRGSVTCDDGAADASCGEAESADAAPDDRLRGRIARKLESKGFSRSDIFRVLEEIRRS